MTSFARDASSDLNNTQAVKITSVDTVNRKAAGVTRYGTTIAIDLATHVGAVQVTPAQGEYWNAIKNKTGGFGLHQKLPYNYAGQLIPAVEGQTQMGSTGPTELNGSQINVNAPLNTQSVATSARPAASSLPAGTQIYDTTLGKPIWTNGTNWHDATGTTV